MNSFTYFTAADFTERKIRNFECNIPIIIDGITEELFETVKKKILTNFGADAVIVIMNDRGESEEKAASELSYAPRLIVKGADFTARDHYTYGDLLEIIARLRDPDGCPWDRAQTHESIRSCAIEEAYELAEAVDLRDRDKMVEESGDVMLQGLFHASIAEEEGLFTANDLIDNLCRKLIFRHTHIFGDKKAADADEALKNWEQAKAVEKGYRGIEDKIASVPVTFGALMRAYKVQKIIKKTGFDFATPSDAEAKITEEVAEFDKAATQAEREKEGGDMLFAVVNTLRMYDIDPETALNGTTNRFIRRFLYVEKKCREAGVELTKEDIDVMEKFYQESKAFEGKQA